MSRLVIAIDGPAGAGKSTVAKRLALELGLRYLDTGAMYRALAVKAIRAGIHCEEGDKLTALAQGTSIGFGVGPDQSVLLDGEDVTSLVRTLEVASMASAASTHSGVRRALVAMQQSMVAQGGLVLEGRDTTTVVAPQADIKVYLTASLEERARRRQIELVQAGTNGEFIKVRRDIEERDHRDITREESPLTVAEDAVVLDSGNLSVDQVMERILNLVRGA